MTQQAQHGWFCLAAAGLAASIACGDTTLKPAKTIVLGALVDRTGNNAEPSWLEAIRLAQKHANEALAQNPRYKDIAFEVVFTDSINEPRIALDRALELVRKNGAKALIVDTSQIDVIVNQTFYDADSSNDIGVPIQCSDCASTFINSETINTADPVLQATFANGLRWNFRAGMSCAPVVRRLVDFLLQRSPNGDGDFNFDRQFKISAYVSNDPYGLAVGKALERAADNLIVEVVRHQRDAEAVSYNWREDIEELTDAVPIARPDAIVVATFAEYHAAFVNNYKGIFDIPVLHIGSLRTRSALQALGALAEGEEGFSTVVLDDGASAVTFAQDFSAGTDSEEPAYLDATYYDNAMTLMLATCIAARELADPTLVLPAEIRDAITKTSSASGERVGTGAAEFARALELIEAGRAIDYAGASGPLDYDADNNVLTRVARFRVQDGRDVELERYDCTQDPVACPGP